MLIVSDDEFLNELNKTGNTRVEPAKVEVVQVNLDNVVSIERGRGIGNVATPNSIRKLIASEALPTILDDGTVIDGASADEISEALPISPSSISAYKHGATSTASYHEPRQALEQHLNSAKTRISKRAQERLESALDGITPDKIADAKLRDIASVARDMSQIVKNMESNDEDIVKNTNIIFYTPNLRKAESFETITLEDN